ncbi:MAG: sugar ABC transporter permease [Firmicutes bacterium]|jgi:putative aldouronate transport system permease protein|nr:sugar ABC transporter permease [Bacillota bacterium]
MNARIRRSGANKKTLGQFLLTHLKNDWQIYVLLLPAILYFFFVHYLPMYGIQIAFRDYKAVYGITESPWVGLKHFRNFFGSYYWKRLFANTLLLNIYGLIAGFPIPILIAILLNQTNSKKFKSFTQTVIYVPHFISTVVLAGMIYIFLSPTNGIINHLLTSMGRNSIYFMAESRWFRPIYIITGIWQNAGWDSILYIAALTGIDPQLYEAATIDGANKLQKIRYIDLPSLVPIITMLLVLNCGQLLGSNTEKALLFQTPGNIDTSDVLGVYVYTMGLGGGQFSYTAAIGLCLNVISFIMIILVNTLVRRMNGSSLF